MSGGNGTRVGGQEPLFVPRYYLVFTALVLRPPVGEEERVGAEVGFILSEAMGTA